MLIIFLGIIFFIPNNVKAETTVTVCKSGCDYTNFDDIANDYTENILQDKNLIVEVGEGEYIDTSLVIAESFQSFTIIGVSKEKTVLNNAILFSSYPQYGKIDIENITLNISDYLDFNIYLLNNLILKDVNINFSYEIIDIYTFNP